MKKFPIILISVICFLLGLKAFSLENPISINGHSIKQLSINTDPDTPTVGEDIDVFELNFTLRSKTGVSKSRIKVFINNIPLSISSNEITLVKVENSDEDVEVYDVEIKLGGIILPRSNNEIIVQYLLSSISPTSIQAQASVAKGAKGGNNNGNGSGGNVPGTGTGNGNLGNGVSLVQAPRLITMILENVSLDSNGDSTVINDPTVSTELQYFRLTIDHDQRLLDVVTEDTYNAATNPVIKRLKIYRIDPNNKNDKVEVTDSFIFSLDEESVALPSNSIIKKQILETVYISDGQLIKERQNLQFVIDLTNFYNNSGVVLESNIITSDKDTIKIKAQELEITDANLSEPINFSATSSSKKKITYTGNSVLSGSFSSSNGTLSTVDSVDFFLTENGKKKTPKIQGKSKNHNLPLKVFDTNGSSTVTNSTFSIPVSFSVSGSNRQFQSGGFYDPTLPKFFKIPFSITTKTTDDLDLILFGTFKESVNAIFDAPLVVNGSSL